MDDTPHGIEMFPAELEVEHYRRHNKDLRNHSDSQLRDHYHRFGRCEGRRTNRLSDRSDFTRLVNRVAQPAEVLEINPFTRPLIPGAMTCDVLTKDELVARAKHLGLNWLAIPDVDIKLGNDSQSWFVDVQRQFGAVVSSHVIEHQLCLVTHLLQVSSLLKPNGRYFLLIPDHRYCFDALLRPSTIAEVLDALRNRRSAHSLKSVIEHRAMTTHNDPPYIGPVITAS